MRSKLVKSHKTTQSWNSISNVIAINRQKQKNCRDQWSFLGGKIIAVNLYIIQICHEIQFAITISNKKLHIRATNKFYFYLLPIKM